MKKNSRETAAEIIYRWLESESFPDRQLAEVRDDRAFVTELVYGCLRTGPALAARGAFSGAPRLFGRR